MLWLAIPSTGSGRLQQAHQYTEVFFHKDSFQTILQSLNFSVCGYLVMLLVHLSQGLIRMSVRLQEVL